MNTTMAHPSGTETSAVGEPSVGNNPDKITAEDKNPDAAEHGYVLLAVVADVIFKKIADAHAHRIGEERFHALLRAAGTVDGNSALQPEKEKSQRGKTPQSPSRLDWGWDIQDSMA